MLVSLQYFFFYVIMFFMLLLSFFFAVSSVNVNQRFSTSWLTNKCITQRDNGISCMFSKQTNPIPYHKSSVQHRRYVHKHNMYTFEWTRAKNHHDIFMSSHYNILYSLLYIQFNYILIKLFYELCFFRKPYVL